MAGFDVIFHDERLLVLNKPAGLLSVPGLGPTNQDCLARRAAAAYPEARVVHRLDRETSGVIVMALEADGHRDLGRQFELRQVAKRYVAVVAGLMQHDEGEIDLPLRKDLDPPTPGPHHIVDHEQGRPALTRYRIQTRDHDRTRVELRPVTGRSHQLRVHLNAIGHPILGDDLYAPPEVVAMADRLLLHAETLSLTHPTTGEHMTFKSPSPF
ncbi:MAG: RluA family pseudouridine synthase [Planctomycetota bacterium]|jgi:tRNA pseudouridine32 synthase/23S rRNA pseudouridine746 synthase